MFALAPATRLAHVTPWLHRLALLEPLWWKHIVQRLQFFYYEQLHFSQPYLLLNVAVIPLLNIAVIPEKSGQFFNRVTI